MTRPALQIADLQVVYRGLGAPCPAVRSVSFSIARGQTLCLVGESGSGKTSTAMAIPRLLPPEAFISGTIEVGGESVYGMGDRELRELRKKRISFIFQDPVGSLVPNQTIAQQLERAVAFRGEISSTATAKKRSQELLEHVGLSVTRGLWESRPAQLSGGMCQRVMIALALCISPEIVVADEPTSALDAITQDKILRLLHRLQLEFGFGMLFVTHDLRISRQIATQIGVMKEGLLVESLDRDSFFAGPAHPYSRQLLDVAQSLSLTAGGRKEQ